MKALIPLITTTALFAVGVKANAQSQAHKYRILAINAADSSVQSISNEINLYLPLRIYIPTAFSPNGDGLNDTFGPVGEGINEFKITVYDRWGEVIFTSHDISTKWDGRHKGSPVPFGSYNYELVASGKEIGQVQKAGSVTLIN
ncbi:MAG: gliding motility-associated C-terminal domain-containing protein [Bacteroidota bacterium]